MNSMTPVMFRATKKLFFEINSFKSCPRLSSQATSKKQTFIEEKGKDRYPGYEKKTIYGEEYPIWHKPMTERPEEFKSNFAIFSLDKLDFTRLEPMDETLSWGEIFRNWFKKQMEKLEIEDQEYSSVRYKTLGPDLAAAHFICYRGGSVKFLNDDKWKKKTKGKYGLEVDIPSIFVPGLYLERIDCEQFANGGLRYEGLENIKNLQYLSWLSFRNCSKFDDWSLDRLSNLVNETVEYLDIRGTNATHRGLSALYRFKKLKFLLVDFSKLNSEEEIQAVEQTLAMLQEYFEDLLIKTD